jgi:pseudouridine synthase
MSGKVGYQTKPCAVRVIGEKKFSITITEGKHRQIRRMCEALGITVMTLTRIRIGNILLEKLKPGEWREIVSVV